MNAIRDYALTIGRQGLGIQGRVLGEHVAVRQTNINENHMNRTRGATNDKKLADYDNDDCLQMQKLDF